MTNTAPSNLEGKERILRQLNDGSLGKERDIILKGVTFKAADVAFTAASIFLVVYTLWVSIFGMRDVMLHRISHLGLIMFVAPLYYPSNIFKRDSLIEKIFNITCAVLGLATSIYSFLNWEEFYRYSSLSYGSIAILVIMVVMVLECTRRSIGLPIVIISLFAILYCLTGQYMPGAIAHKGYTFTRVINLICVGTEGLYSSTLGTASLEIAAFLIFSSLLQCSGALKYFMRLAFAVAGNYAGGPAKVAVVSSAMMGTVSGSTVANVTATGSVTIPLMKLMGFEPAEAGSIEAAASAGGSLTPPVLGATAFLIAEFLSVSYWTVAKAAVIPAVLYYICLFNAVHVKSVKNGHVGLDKKDLPTVKSTLLDSIFLLLPIFVLVYFMFRQYTAVYAAFWAIIALLIVANIKKDTRLNLENLRKTCRITLQTALSVTTACATAGIVVAALSMTGLGQKMGFLISEVSGGNLLIALILTQLAALLLGTGLVTPAVYTLLAVLISPTLINLGAHRIAAHLFIFHFAIICTLTPPVCLSAYAAAGIAEANPMTTGVKSFILALPGFLVPYFFVMNPALLGEGTLPDIAISFGTAVVGVMFMGYALEGFMKKKLTVIERLLCGTGGVLMVYPDILASAIGLGINILAVVIMRSRKDKAAA